MNIRLKEHEFIIEKTTFQGVDLMDDLSKSVTAQVGDTTYITPTHSLQMQGFLIKHPVTAVLHYYKDYTVHMAIERFILKHVNEYVPKWGFKRRYEYSLDVAVDEGNKLNFFTYYVNLQVLLQINSHVCNHG